MIAKTADMVDRPWLVQKFGGTSLGKLLATICSTIIPNYNEEHRLVVVCSALSGDTKASGTTSLLLECIELAELGVHMQQKLLDIVHLLRDNHLAVLDSFCDSEQPASLQVCKETKSRIVTECEGLENFLLAAQIVGELSPRAKDRVVSLGEKLSSVIVAACLANQGIPATAVYLDDVVASAFGTSASDQAAAFDKLGSKFYHAIAKEIAVRIKNCGDTIPIVTGKFFGIKVGRGYSDFCAAMCAVAVEAVELQIWKEVDGIFTADPRKIPSAQLLSSVTADEIAELSYYGSEVLHPLTMDQIREANISFRLKNVFKPNSPGTIIDFAVNLPQTIKITPPPGVLLKGDFTVGRNDRRRPTAVTIKDDILLINVICNRNTVSAKGIRSSILGLPPVKIHSLSANIRDMITTSERNVSLAVHSPGDSSAVLRLQEELKSFGSVNITENMSIVTLVGHKMRSQIGVANDALTALAMASINIHLISQGASEISISFVVSANEAEPALNAIHRDVLKIPTIEESRFRRSKQSSSVICIWDEFWVWMMLHAETDDA
ncbi:aspartate kinase [Xylariaceae sp. FL1019]|nr:aspartate kinase [Xylariaceae sp. FL1019]